MSSPGLSRPLGGEAGVKEAAGRVGMVELVASRRMKKSLASSGSSTKGSMRKILSLRVNLPATGTVWSELVTTVPQVCAGEHRRGESRNRAKGVDR